MPRPSLLDIQREEEIVSDFYKKWLRNHPKFLLHFLIHIDVLMLCRKFELIPTNIFRVMSILKNEPIIIIIIVIILGL